jgi:hypothetical protein
MANEVPESNPKACRSVTKHVERFAHCSHTDVRRCCARAPRERAPSRSPQLAGPIKRVIATGSVVQSRVPKADALDGIAPGLTTLMIAEWIRGLGDPSAASERACTTMTASARAEATERLHSLEHEPGLDRFKQILFRGVRSATWHRHRRVNCRVPTGERGRKSTMPSTSIMATEAS